MIYKLNYRDDLFSDKGNVPEEVIIRQMMSKFVNDIPLDELKALFGFKKEKGYDREFFYDNGRYIEYSLKFNTYMRDLSNLREIEWVTRYSDTDSPDKQGRWARIAYIGNKDNFGFDGETRSRQFFEIAWISKTVINEEIHFVVSYRFPGNNQHIFETLEDAKHEVETNFRNFITNCFDQ